MDYAISLLVLQDDEVLEVCNRVVACEDQLCACVDQVRDMLTVNPDDELSAMLNLEHRGRLIEGFPVPSSQLTAIALYLAGERLH